MHISARGLSKRFSKEWVFKDLDFEFESNKCYAIKGANGSGKSTLLKVISGKIPGSRGTLNVSLNGKPIKDEDRYKYISMSAPYQELIEEFTLYEMVDFHFKMNDIIQNLKVLDFIELLGLSRSHNKSILDFSSGMKQKLNLGLALYTNKPCLILDEPSSNLDRRAIKWFKDHLSRVSGDRTIIIASNDDDDFQPESIDLSIEDYK